MAVNDLYTYYPHFNEFLPVYRDVVQIWVGDGVSTGTAGMLYARYQNNSVAEIGYVSLYETAVKNGFTGTQQEWVQAIAGVARLVKGSEVSFYYQVSTDGVNHPAENSNWSTTPVYEQGKYTWVKVNLLWVDGSVTPLYFPTYQSRDGLVTSVNNEIGDIFLHGNNLLINAGANQTIKEYIDENDIPNTATQEEIDALFSMAMFSGAVFITGRRFEEGDSITLAIEPITQGAPIPLDNTITIYPTSGNSWHFGFEMLLFGPGDIPTGQTSQTYQYRVREVSHTIGGVDLDTTQYTISVKLTDMGDGTVSVEKSANYNLLYFNHSYDAMGRITFSGSIQLDGRAMAAREFMVRIKEGNEVIADNISTAIAGASGQAVPIIFPPINYTLDDIGTHIYTVQETSTSGDGVTISDTVYTVTVQILDELRDGVLEIVTNGSDQNLDFVNTYVASGTATFVGTKSVTHRVYIDTDTCLVNITGNGKLPSPAQTSVSLTIGESSADFSFVPVTYTLTDMQNGVSGYDDVKTFTYTVTETANIPGVTGDGLMHTITVKVTDNKRGQLIPEITYSDGNRVQLGGTYNATGSLVITGSKVLTNRNFVSGDTMSVSIRATNSGKLPYTTTIPVTLPVGQNIANFNFTEVTYTLADINYLASKTFSYIAEEATVITGATNDAVIHTLDVVISDNHDGTLDIVPTYGDGNKFIFESIYNATGYLAIIGTKTLQNRNFVSGDTMSVTIAATDGGKLPNPSTLSVPLTVGANAANFNFAQISYNVSDLIGQNSKIYNYTATETYSMAGVTTSSRTDPFTVTLTDNADGTLSVVPSYTSNNKVNFVNSYGSSGNLSFKVREIITNGDLNAQPFTVRVTQVTGNNSTTQASNNVVLAAPATLTTNYGSSQDLNFTNVVNFVKDSTRDDTSTAYWFLIEQVVPTLDSYNINNNVYYDTNKKWINVSVTDNSDGTLTVTKTPTADAVTGVDMTFTNEQLGSLIITNTWSGESSTLSNAQKESISFTIAGPNGYSTNFTYGSMINDSKSFNSLTLGEYTVTQADNTFENYVITPSYAVNQTATNHVTLTDGTAKTIAVTTNVNKLQGSLTVTMAFTGSHSDLTAAQKNGITFTVTGPKQISTDSSTYSYAFTYSDMTNNSITLPNLTPGTYTVTVSNHQFTGYEATVSYVVNNTSTNQIAVVDDGNAVMAVSIAYVTLATLNGRTFVFNDNLPEGDTAIEVDVSFSDDNSDTYSKIRYNLPGTNDRILEYFSPDQLNWVLAYGWNDIGTNIWTNNDMKTITFTQEPTSFSGVANVNEFETWLLSAATEET